MPNCELVLQVFKETYFICFIRDPEEGKSVCINKKEEKHRQTRGFRVRQDWGLPDDVNILR